MQALRIVTALGIVVAAVQNAAHAAEPPLLPAGLPPPVIRAQPAAPDPVSGWYLRGDIGFRIQDAKASAASGFSDPTDSRLGSVVMGGVGAGFRADQFRFDVTLDYASAAGYSGQVANAGDVSAKLQAATGLFNIYYDIATFGRVTPYIGAGAGLANILVSDYSSAVTPPFTPVGTASHWNFAWAVMGGASYAVTPRLALDFGYRFINFGDAPTLADSSGAMTFYNIHAHEFRLGARWFFADPVEIP